MNVGIRIKKRREEIGMSVDEIAKRLGKNRATIYRYESKAIENMPITIIEPLAKILQVSPEYLLGWENTSAQEQANSECSKEEIEIIKLYRSLNKAGKGKLVEYINDLMDLEKYKKNNNLFGDTEREAKHA